MLNRRAGWAFASLPHAMGPLRLRPERRKAVWGPKRTLAAAVFVVLGLVANAAAAPKTAPHGKLDRELTYRADHLPATAATPVIVTLQPGAQLPAEFKRFAKANGKLGIINGQVLTVPNGILKQLALHPSVFDVHYDRPLHKENYRTALTTGARVVNTQLGLTGAGVGVAVIDSGIASWHDDLTNRSSATYPYGNQRVSAFVDFVNGRLLPYDDDGHGTHVAGIIAGNGYDSNGQKAGMAPDASLVALKVLDTNGRGTISNIIAAFDWVLANHATYNIRVVNISVGAAVRESYWTDPLTLAAKRVVDAGVVVVAAAGNLGRNALGVPQYGGISAPANAPWVVTVGASSTNGTAARVDDTIAPFSSRGPTFIDFTAKPDLVAPGVATVSLSDPWGTMYTTKAASLVTGTIKTPYQPYLSLSGTSMAAPVVSGTVALMLQANPSLTPNAVKWILEYTAQVYPGYNALTEGAGFLNSAGAVTLAKFYATVRPGQRVPTQHVWGKRVIWGNQLLTGGVPNPAANAFGLRTTWGAVKTDAGDNIVWGTQCTDKTCDNIVWGTDCPNPAACDNIVWGTECPNPATCDNIVWGTGCPNPAACDNIVWGTQCAGAACDNIVWGTQCGGANCDNIVWGTQCTGAACDNIVWGTDCSTGVACDNIVWGTACTDVDVCGDHVAWGTADEGDTSVWSTPEAGDNIVWGTLDNIVWGTLEGDNIVWGTGTDRPASTSTSTVSVGGVM